MVTIEELGDEVVHVVLNREATWDHSEFPHPLVTVDYDEQNKLIGVEGVGPQAAKVVQAYLAWRESDDRSQEALLAQLPTTGES